MKQVSLSGSLRGNVGKKDARKLRREGKIPCVMYGGKEQVHFLIEEKVLSKLIFTPDVYIIQVTINGAHHDTIMQEVQYHPVSDRVLHADFLEVTGDKPITIAVPVHLTGTPKGVLKGGRLIRKVRKLKIRTLLEDLPDFIEIDIADLDIGQSVIVSDLQRDKVEFLDAPRNVIVGVRSARTVVEEVPEAAAEEAPEETEETGEKPAEE